jgi:hypothetical protein
VKLPFDIPFIYGRVLKIFCLRTHGQYKGKKFYHDFKPDVVLLGLPSGSTIVTAEGSRMKLASRSAILVSKAGNDLWE